MTRRYTKGHYSVKLILKFTSVFSVVFLFAGCTSWQLADYGTPQGRYNRNLSAGWGSHVEIDKDGNEQRIEVEEELPRYVDLILKARRFEMVYYKEGNDSVVEFVQKGRWYMEKQHDSLYIILNYKNQRNHDKLSFGANAGSGYYDELITYPTGHVFQKCERLF